MAQILVTSEKNIWYHSIASLRNYYEADLEDRVLKHKDEIFRDYFALKCKFSFKNKEGEKAEPEMVLISRDFKSWIIVELELGGKQLDHTKKQLRVFNAPEFNEEKLADDCIRKEKSLTSKKDILKKLFRDIPPKTLMIFDYYDSKTFKTLKTLFQNISFCIFEIYNTHRHINELYRFSGEYPYVTVDFSFLKERKGNYEIYAIEKPNLVDGLADNEPFEILHRTMTYRVILMKNKINDVYLKIPNNPFPPGKTLYLKKTIDNKFIIDTI